MPRLETAAGARTTRRLPRGFWGLARIGRGRRRRRSRCARVSASGAVEEAALAHDPGRRAGRAAAAARRWSRSAWPPASRRSTLFRRQVESIRAQTHDRLGLRDQRRLLGARALRRDAARCSATTRASCSRASRTAARLLPQLRARAGAGARRRALRRARRPGRRAGTRTSSRRCWRELGDAQLVYSDARVGRRRRPRARRHATGAARSNNHSNLLSLLVANSVTGAASLFPRRAARRRAAVPARPVRALPRPLARARGALRSATSRSSSGRSTTTSSTATRRSGTPPRTACRRMRERLDVAAPRPARADPAVAHALLRRRLPAAAVHDGPAAALRRRGWRAAKRRALERFERADRSLAALAGLCAGAARRSCWAGGRDTLGAEWMLAHALRLAPAARRRPRATAPHPLRCGSTRCRRPAFDPRPGARAPAEPAVRAIAEKIAPLRLAVRDGAPRRVNLLDPVDRPPALLRGLHRQVQPRAAAGGARRARADRHRRPRRRAAARAGGATSRPTAGSTGCSTRSRSSSGASRRASR